MFSYDILHVNSFITICACKIPQTIIVEVIKHSENGMATT